LCWLTGCFLARHGRLNLPWIAVVAVAARALAWQLPPAFTDDLLRYRWEGRLQAAGGNPYTVRPVDRPELLRAEDHLMPGRDVKAVYGPFTLWTERVAYQVSHENLRHLRWPFALADLALLALLLHRFRARAIVYAWCPLPVFEFWMNGHNDALCLLALALMAWAFARERPALGWMALGVAILTKWWPLMLVPLAAGRDARRWRALPWIALPGVLFWPYGWPPLDNAQFATGFVGGWRNNDSLFGGLLWAAGGNLYPAKYAGFALLAAWILWLATRRWSDSAKMLAAVAGLLVVSANVHPWYLSWLLVFAVESPFLFPLIWIALAPLYYEPVLVWRALEVWNGVRDSRWWPAGGAAAAGVRDLSVFRRGTRTK